MKTNTIKDEENYEGDGPGLPTETLWLYADIKRRQWLLKLQKQVGWSIFRRLQLCKQPTW